jgi:hypothetical protein
MEAAETRLWLGILSLCEREIGATRTFPGCASRRSRVAGVAPGFFAPGALPDGTTRATRARIAEVFGGVAVSELW